MIQHDDQGRVRGVAWNQVLPWLSLFRTFRIAVSFRHLILGGLGILLTVSGWWLLDRAFAPADAAGPWDGVVGRCPWLDITASVPDSPDLTLLADPRTPGATAMHSVNPLWQAWLYLSHPLILGMHRSASFPQVACFLLSGLWAAAVWAFFGTAICRTAAVQLAADERTGLFAALRFAMRKWISAFSAPIFPLLGIALLAAPVAVAGMLLRVGPGVVVAGLIWPLLLLAGLMITTLLVGLVFGWPLMFATISSEGTDSFDALSRSYAYTYQRPLHYLLYALIAAVIGALGWLVVKNFAATVIALTYWAASWGGGYQATEVVRTATADQSLVGAGATLVQFWTQCVKLLAVGFVYSYFFVAATAIYFLLRRDVDATEMDEVHLEGETDERGLPPIGQDASGAPVVVQPTAAANDAPPSPPPAT